MTQSWNEHARTSESPKRSTAQPMTLPAGAVSKSASLEARSTVSLVHPAPALMVRVLTDLTSLPSWTGPHRTALDTTCPGQPFEYT